MANTSKMLKTTCAICKKQTPYIRLYAQNFSEEQIDKKIFSARRLPDRIHPEIIKCKVCGLVRCRDVLESDKLKGLYSESLFTYDNETQNLKRTYEFYLEKASKVSGKKRFLEIGCGNGFMLEKALELGYKQVFGIEPSQDAINNARKDIKSKIKKGFFSRKSYRKDYFDLICMFQTFDHMLDPNEVLKGCYDSLKKGGIVLALNHDVSYWPIKLLGDRWPIIDIEHPYLYDKKTIKKIFEMNNFKIIGVFSVKNIFSFGYIVHLLPLPKAVKNLLKNLLSILDLDKKNITLYPGNLGIIARKGFTCKDTLNWEK